MDALPEVEEEDKTGNSSDEELWGFFENMDKASPDTIEQTDKTDILVRFVICSRCPVCKWSSIQMASEYRTKKSSIRMAKLSDYHSYVA